MELKPSRTLLFFYCGVDGIEINTISRTNATTFLDL